MLLFEAISLAYQRMQPEKVRINLVWAEFIYVYFRIIKQYKLLLLIVLLP
jgi:hypothetical protein